MGGSSSLPDGLTRPAVRVSFDHRESGPVVTHCSETVRSVLGYDPDRLVGRPLDDLLAVDDRTESALTGVSVALRAADGARVPVAAGVDVSDGESTVTFVPVDPQNGRTTTGRRGRRERRLERERRKLELVLSKTKTGIAEWNLRTGEIGWDRTLRDLLGATPDTVEEFLGLVHPADRNRVQRAIEAMLSTGDPAGPEYRLVGADGQITWVSTRGVVLSEDGEPTTLLATLTEVTAQKRQEHEAVLATERARLFTENIEEYAFVRVDEAGTVLTWNAGAKRLFGYDAETAVGLSTDELFGPADDGDGDAVRRRHRTDAGSYTGWLTRADGSRFYADVQYVPTADGLDDARQFTVLVHDLTDQFQERRRTERFLEESVDVVSVIGPDGRFEYLSGSVASVLGYDPADLTGQNAFDLVHPADQFTAMREFFASVEHPDRQASAEFRFRDPAGEWRVLDVRGRNLLDDDAVGGMLVYARDVTDEKRHARRFEAIFNQTYQLTGVLDPDGTWVEINERALALGDFDRDAVVGTPVWETPWWDHDPACRERLREAVGRAAEGELLRYETEVLGHDGLSTLDFSLKPVYDENGAVMLLVLEGRDVTAQRRQRQHAAVLQRVLRHNIRNDLGKLRGYVELLADTDTPGTRERAVGVVEAVLDKWESMTARVGEMQRILREQAQYDRTVDAWSLVSEVTAAANESYPDAVVEATLPTSVTASVPPAVGSALTELVDNAVAADDGGTSRVGLSLSRVRPGWVDVRVTDEGPGMPRSEADVLAHGEETPLNHGQGLGLWLVRSIVAQAGGWVSVDVTDAGTAVTLHLPDGSTGSFRNGSVPDVTPSPDPESLDGLDRPDTGGT
jgi:PAS domain S-box-containing protein